MDLHIQCELCLQKVDAMPTPVGLVIVDPNGTPGGEYAMVRGRLMLVVEDWQAEKADRIHASKVVRKIRFAAHASTCRKTMRPPAPDKAKTKPDARSRRPPRGVLR